MIVTLRSKKSLKNLTKIDQGKNGIERDLIVSKN
jgi:hypothetical protein